jgi:hypothetical protein
MKRADFQRVIDEEKKKVACFLCAHNCHIKEGKRGIPFVAWYTFLLHCNGWLQLPLLPLSEL